MKSNASGPTLDSGAESATDTDVLLRALVNDFGNSPLTNGRRMRELIQFDSAEFRRSAVTLLRGEADRRGYRYLLTLLWTHDLLLPILSDESIPIDRALFAAQVAADVDPQLHIRITRYLIATTLEQQTIKETEATRLLRILGSINDSVSLQPFVRQMLLHPSARIRSKLSLLIGRSQSGNKSLATLLSDPDARVRANAIEALWHNQNPQICTLVRAALDDANNRVVGNALLGLYFAGDTLAIHTAIKLTAHPEPLFRATAAWAMGETGDPRFLARLGRMLADSVGPLRKAVFRAIGLIKKAAAARAAGPPLRISILDVVTVANGKTRVQAVLTANMSASTIDAPPTAFVIESNGALVTEYSCAARSDERAYIALAVPRGAGLGEEDCLIVEQAIKYCVRAKRVSDQWAIAWYSAGEPRTASTLTLFGQALDSDPGAAVVSARASYTANPVALNRAAEARSNRFETDPSLLASLRGLIAGTPGGSGAKHLVAVVPDPEFIEDHVLAELIQVARACRLSIHVVSLYPAPQYFRLCCETQGFYRETTSLENLPLELEAICAGVAKLYQLEFAHAGENHAGDNHELALDVHLPSATGKCYWRRPGFLESAGYPEVA